MKGSKYLEQLSHVRNAIFDKTGTLTSGTLNISKVVTAGDLKEDEVLRLAALCESYSNHPIAKAIADLSLIHI